MARHLQNSVAANEAIRQLLEHDVSPARAAQLLAPYGLKDPRAAARDLRRLAADAECRALVGAILPALLAEIADAAEPDRALNNLERIAAAASDRRRFLAVLRDDPATVHLLCRLTGSSQAFAETLIREPDLLDWLRAPGVLETGRTTEDSALRFKQELSEELDAGAADSKRWSAVMRRFKRRQFLRIGALDLLNRANLPEITAQISALADAEIEAALRLARTQLSKSCRPPEYAAGEPILLAVIGLGKLGGGELNYSSDIDLIFVYGSEGSAQQGRQAHQGRQEITAREYFTRLAREIVRALDEVTDEGHVFRTDLRLRPEGAGGELALSLDRTLHYYRRVGRAWERQALLKARPVAGDLALGRRFIQEIQPFVYPKYLSLEAIGEIRQLKGQMEAAARARGEAESGVKQGVGGIRDIEYTVQFLQLLHGGQIPALRVSGTLAVISRLRREHILTAFEAETLRAAYEFLRTVEHRLQTMHDLKRHALPDDPARRAIVARQLGYRDTPDKTALAAFEAQFKRTQQDVRAVFDLLFGAGFHEAGAEADALTELILMPHAGLNEGGRRTAEILLASYGLQDPRRAHKRLVNLAREESTILQSPRTRTNLAKFAPALFAALSESPAPDQALGHLERIAASIGAKAVFYEMLTENRSVLRMVVDIAVYSVFLTELLVRYPGMLDVLVDSLQTGRDKDPDQMRRELDVLLAGAVNADAILKSFQAGELLRIGVRDLLHEANLGETFRGLSALAEIIVAAVVSRVLSARGDANSAFGSRFAVIALGKLGGRELTYGSDLDLVFVRERVPGVQAERFEYLGQVLMKNLSSVTEHGKLYDLDLRLRPTGGNSPLAPSLDRYRAYAQADLQFWERLVLTRARFVAGDPRFGAEVEGFMRDVAYGLNDAVHAGAMLPEDQARREIAHMRHRIQKSAHHASLKKGHGGLVDIEFIVQTLQVLHGAEEPEIRITNTYDALRALHAADLLADGHYLKLHDAYRFLRTIESRLRIVHGTSAECLPKDPAAFELLARRAGYEASSEWSAAEILREEYAHHTRTTRAIFEELIGKPE